MRVVRPDVASVVVEESVSEPVGSVLGVKLRNQGDIMQSMIELLRAQVQAMTQAAAAQSLSPLACYNGDGGQMDEEEVDRWLERFVKRGQLVGWSEEVKLFQLKLHMKGNALHVHKRGQKYFCIGRRGFAQLTLRSSEVRSFTARLKQMGNRWSSEA